MRRICDCESCRTIAAARRRRESLVALAWGLVGCVCVWGAIALRSACEWGCR